MQFKSVCLLVFVAGAGFANARNVGVRSQTFLGFDTNLQPEVVASSLAHVQEEWEAQAGDFAECTMNGDNAEDCSNAQKAFQLSCSKVVVAVVQGSSGDRGEVQEYMSDVCGQPVLHGWKRDDCHSLSSLVLTSLTSNTFFNREHLNSARICKNFWTTFTVVANERAQKDRVERDAREQKEAGERADTETKIENTAAERAKEERKEAEDHARDVINAEQAEEKRVDEERGVAEAAADRRQMASDGATARHDTQAAAEAKQMVVEAKKQAEEAVTRLAAKRAEADHDAEEAKKKAEEAHAAAKSIEQYNVQHKEQASAAQAVHTQATVEVVATTTSAVPMAQLSVAQDTEAIVVES